ncbi:MAG: MFS transporter [Chloroflexi bacterium]|nr:MFS transporter [Chloroflexota bacterium]MDA1004573.1 MFS transporter [Chloroflexota bacterium]
MSARTFAHANDPPTRLFTRPFWLAIFAVHAYFVSYYMSLVQIPKVLENEPDWLVGLVVGMLGIAGMLTRPLVGVWVDAGNRQRWLRIGAVATVIAFAGYALDLGPWWALPLRALHGIAMGLFTTALLAIVTGLLPADRRGLGVGVYQTSNTVAGLYGAALAIWLIADASFTVAFAIAAVAAALALLFGVLVGDPDPPEAGPAAPRVPMRARRWISTTALLPATVFLTVTAPFGAVTTFLPLFADERSLGNVGFFYTALALAQLTARSSSGWLSDRLGRPRVVVPALAIALIALVVLATAQRQSTLLVAAALYGLGIAGTQTSIVALIVDRTPRVALGSAMATYTMAWDVGTVIGAVALGAVAGATSYGTVFALCALFPALGIALFLLRVRDRALPVDARSDEPRLAAGS